MFDLVIELVAGLTIYEFIVAPLCHMLVESVFGGDN